MAILSKQEFVDKYRMSATTYHRRMKKLRETECFNMAYSAVTNKEIIIDTDLYDQWRMWYAHNKNAARPIKPRDWLAGKRW